MFQASQLRLLFIAETNLPNVTCRRKAVKSPAAFFAPLDRKEQEKGHFKQIEGASCVGLINFMDTFIMCARACTVRAGVQLNSSVLFSVTWKPDSHSLGMSLSLDCNV